MDAKIIFYVVIALLYYGYQAYKKFSDDKNKPILEPENVPQKTPQKEIISYPTHIPRTTNYTDNQAVTQKYVDYEKLENEKTIAMAFKPTNIEEGISYADLTINMQYHKAKKINKTKVELVGLLKNKSKLKTSFVFNEVMQRKF